MEERLDTLQKIEIAEGVEIDVRPAGFLVRGGAFMIDVLIKVGIIFFAQLIFNWIIGIFFLATGDIEFGFNIVSGLNGLLMFLLMWIYDVYFDLTAKAASPGKRAFKIRVAQLSGAPITFQQSVVRNILKFADILPMFGFVGMISILSNKRAQRLGDLAAETVVVYTGEVDFLRRADGNIEVGETLRPMVDLSREEQMAILLFSERARDWTEPRREELAAHAGGLIPSSNRKERVMQLLNIARWIRSNQ